MKNSILIFILLLLMSHLQAQDIIFTKKKGKVNAKVWEVETKYIKYKKSDNPGGPLYSMQTALIDSIVYENGGRDIFHAGGKKLTEKQIAIQKQFEKMGNNLLSGGLDFSAYTEITDFLFPENDGSTPYVGVFVNYERLFLKQKLGFAVSGFTAWNRMYNGASAALRFYPKNHKRVRVGFGTRYIYSMQQTGYRFYTYDHPEGFGSTFAYISKSHNTALGFDFTVQGNINRKVFLAGDFFLGGRLKSEPVKNNLPAKMSENYENGDPVLNLRIGAGYRF